MIGGGIAGCSVALPPRQGGVAGDRAAREGGADERVDPPRGRARDPVQPVVDDDALPALQRRAVPRARRLRGRRQRPHRVERGEPARAAPSRERGRGHRARGRADLARRGARAAARGRRRADPRRRLDARRRPCRPAHRHPRGGGRGAGARRRHPAADSRDRDRARRAARGARRPHRSRAGSRPSTSSTRPASGRRRWRRWSARSSRRCRSTTSTSRCRPSPGTRSRATRRASATPTTSSTARRRPAACSIGGYEPDPPARWTDGVPWDHAASPVESDMDRFAPLLEGAIRRFPFLEDAGVVRLLCHPDAMTPDGNPLLGPMPGRARLLGRGRPVAQRLRRRGRARQGAGGVDDRRRDRGRRRALPRLALRARLPRHRRGRRDRARGLPLLLPAALPARHEPGRPRAPAQPAPRAPRRSSARCSAPKNGWERADYFEPGRRWRRAGEDQRAFGWNAPPYLERLAEEHRRGPRARRHLRLHVVRQARGLAARARWRCSSACATPASTARSGAWSTRSS